jgi:H+-translocating NAD(P) transhydrogenase subunit alpha
MPSDFLIFLTPMLFAAESPADHAAGIDYIALLFVFMLATFTGLLVIRNVSRLLHTPLMSLTNAISAIAVVGSIALAGRMESGFTTVLGAVAVFASMTNIVSGFLLTDRMLKMFKKREPGKS